MPQSLPLFHLQAIQKTLTVTLFPPITDASWGEIEQAGADVLHRLQTVSQPELIIDLTSLRYMGSSQVALLARLWKGVKTQDGEMVVATDNPTVHQVLTLAGLDRVWTIVPNVSEAHAHFGRTVPSTEAAIAAPAAAGSPMPHWLGLMGFLIGVTGGLLFVSELKQAGQSLLWLGTVLTLGAGLWGVSSRRERTPTAALLILLGGIALLCLALTATLRPEAILRYAQPQGATTIRPAG